MTYVNLAHFTAYSVLRSAEHYLEDDSAKAFLYFHRFEHFVKPVTTEALEEMHEAYALTH